MFRTRNIEAKADIKFILIAGFCLLAVFGVFLLVGRQEKYALRRQLDEALKKKDTMDYRAQEILKTITPLREELESLKKLLPSASPLGLAERRARGEPSEGDDRYSPKPKPKPESEPEFEPESMKAGESLPESKSKKRGPSPDLAKSNSAQKGLNRLKDYVKNLEADNVSLKGRVVQLNTQLDSKDVELLKLNSENVKLSLGLDGAIKANNELKKNLEADIQLLSNLKGQLSQRESEAADFNKIKAGLEKQVSELNNKLSSLTAVGSQLEKQALQYQQDRLLSEREISRLNEELSAKTSFAEPLAKKINELTVSLNTRDSSLANLTKELLQVKEAKASIEAELNQLKLVNAGRQEQATQLSLRINESKASYENLKDTTSQLSSLLNKKELELTERQIELRSLRDNFDRISQEKSALDNSLKDKEKTISDLSASVTGLQSKLVRLEEELAAPKKLQAKTAEQLNELTSVSNFLQDKLSGISKELSTLNTQAEQDKIKALELKKRVEVMLDVEKEGLSGASIKEERF